MRSVWARSCRSVPFGIVRRKLPTDSFIGVRTLFIGCSYEMVSGLGKSTWRLLDFPEYYSCVRLPSVNPCNLFAVVVLPSYKRFQAWCRVPRTIDDLLIHSDGIPWWDGIVLRQVFFCFSWAVLHKSNRVKCSHLSFLETEDEVRCLHSLLIIMDWVFEWKQWICGL